MIKPFVDQFKDFHTPVEDRQANTWRDRVADMVRTASDTDLNLAEKKLGTHENDCREFRNDRAEAIANLLLHADTTVTHEAVRELVQGIDTDSRWILVQSLLPGWVSPAAARHVIPITEDPDRRKRNFAINAVSHQTAILYAKRAFCCDTRVSVISISEVSGEESCESIVKMYDAALLRCCGYGAVAPSDEYVKDCIEGTKKDLWFVVFGDAAVDKGVPEILRDRYSEMTFVILCGEERPAPVGKDLVPELIEPTITVAKEDTGRLFVSRMCRLAGRSYEDIVSM